MAHFNWRERKQNKVGLRFHIRTPVSKLLVGGGEERPYGGRPSPIGRRQRSRRQPDAAAVLVLVSVPLITRYVMS